MLLVIPSVHKIMIWALTLTPNHYFSILLNMIRLSHESASCLGLRSVCAVKKRRRLCNTVPFSFFFFLHISSSDSFALCLLSVQQVSGSVGMLIDCYEKLSFSTNNHFSPSNRLIIHFYKCENMTQFSLGPI